MKKDLRLVEMDLVGRQRVLDANDLYDALEEHDAEQARRQARR